MRSWTRCAARVAIVASSRWSATASSPTAATEVLAAARALFALPEAEKLGDREHPLAPVPWLHAGGPGADERRPGPAGAARRRRRARAAVSRARGSRRTGACSARTSGPRRCPSSATVMLGVHGRDGADRADARPRAGPVPRPARRPLRLDVRAGSVAAPQGHPLPAGRRRRRRTRASARTRTTATSRSCCRTRPAGSRSARPGGFVDVPPVPGSFVCNIGEMFEVTSRGYYEATVHRVRQPAAGPDRISVPYFFGPRLDARLDPVDAAGGAASRRSTAAGGPGRRDAGSRRTRSTRSTDELAAGLAARAIPRSPAGTGPTSSIAPPDRLNRSDWPPFPPSRLVRICVSCTPASAYSSIPTSLMGILV